MDASGHAKPHTLARRLKVTAVALCCSLVALVVAAVFLGKQAQLVRESMAAHTALGGWVAACSGSPCLSGRLKALNAATC